MKAFENKDCFQKVYLFKSENVGRVYESSDTLLYSLSSWLLLTFQENLHHLAKFFCKSVQKKSFIDTNVGIEKSTPFYN